MSYSVRAEGLVNRIITFLKFKYSVSFTIVPGDRSSIPGRAISNTNNLYTFISFQAFRFYTNNFQINLYDEFITDNNNDSLEVTMILIKYS